MSDFDYRQKAWSAGLIVLFFVAWELFCIMTGMSDLVLPRPSQVFVTLFEKFPILWPHILQTLATTMIGFVLGVGLGVVLGAIIGVSKTAYDTAYPLLVGFSSIPNVAVVPIFVLWFGSGTVPAVLTALSICFFPIVVNIATGLATTEPELEDVLKALGASKLDILWNVGLPRTMPFFFASLKVAVSYAFVGAVLSETVASNRGIGNVMMTASSNFNVPLVFAGLFVLAGLGVALYVIFSVIEGRITGWATRKNDIFINCLQPVEEIRDVSQSKCRAVGSCPVCRRCPCPGDDDQVYAGLEDARLRRRILLCQGPRLLQGRRPQRGDRPGRGLGRDRHAHHVGRL
jgi:NitT/TauT family transport system permease protein